MTGDVARRTVLQGAAVAVGGGVLAACGSSSAQDTAEGQKGPTAAAPSASGAAGGEVLAKVADLPVGQATSVKAPDGPVLLVRTSQDAVTGFSAVCPHQGCTVAPAGAQLECPCHGSAFQTATGALVHGPATRGLSAYPVKVVDGAVVRGQ